MDRSPRPYKIMKTSSTHEGCTKSNNTQENNNKRGECEVLKNWKSNVEAVIALQDDIKLDFVKNVKK